MNLLVLLLSHFSHVWLYDPVDCSPPGSFVCGMFQVRMLEWGAISSSRESSWPRDRTCGSCIAGRYCWATREARDSSYILFLTLYTSSVLGFFFFQRYCCLFYYYYYFWSIADWQCCVWEAFVGLFLVGREQGWSTASAGSIICGFHVPLPLQLTRSRSRRGGGGAQGVLLLLNQNRITLTVSPQPRCPVFHEFWSAQKPHQQVAPSVHFPSN